MKYHFDIHKTVAAAGYLLSRAGGSWDLLKLVKAVYAADKAAMVWWYRPITGDSFVSMPEGPVPSTTYDLINGKATHRYQATWDSHIAGRRGNTVVLVKGTSQDVLSDREIEVLEMAFKKVDGMSAGKLIDWMHKQPEWDDPGKSSKPIKPETIFAKNTLMTPQEISELSSEVEGVGLATSFFA